MTREELLKVGKLILFNTEMVKAILDGRKTCTRRVIKFPEGMTGHLPESGATDYIYYPGGIKRPPYKVGDILYVRETWCYGADTTEILFEPEPRAYDILYRADYKYLDEDIVKWKPSIHMPKTAARIFLKVTDVRVERIMDITEEQAIKEGFNSREEFIKAILEIYPECTEESWVWVIEFERVEVEQ